MNQQMFREISLFCTLNALLNIYDHILTLLMFFRTLRKMLALPFLPTEHIGVTFENLESRVEDHATLLSLATYIRATWFSSNLAAS